MDNQNKIVTNYCKLETCEGIPAEFEDIDTDFECPICYDRDLKKVSVLIPCLHKFCYSCFSGNPEPKTTNYYPHYTPVLTCPMCRNNTMQVLVFSDAIIPRNKCFVNKHMDCYFNNSDCKELFLELNEEWKKFMRFAMFTQYYMEIDVTVKDQDLKRIASESKNLFIFKMPDGNIKIVVYCYLYNFTARILLRKHENNDVEVDNEYADHAVACLNKQIDVCFNVLPRLLKKNYVFVRKFENVTACLHLIPTAVTNVTENNSFHHMPMKDEIEKLKICNFDQTYLSMLKRSLPKMALTASKETASYAKVKNCCKEDQ